MNEGTQREKIQTQKALLPETRLPRSYDLFVNQVLLLTAEYDCFCTKMHLCMLWFLNI